MTSCLQKNPSGNESRTRKEKMTKWVFQTLAIDHDWISLLRSFIFLFLITIIHTQKINDVVLKFSNKFCVLFFLQKLLYRNQEYSIQLFITIIQSPGICIAFFYNKKILFGFYYVLSFRKWNSCTGAFWWQLGWGFRYRQWRFQSWFWCYCIGSLWGKHPRNYWHQKWSDYLW